MIAETNFREDTSKKPLGVVETVKGFRDFTGEEAKKREKIREIFVKNFELFNFEPAEPPIIEYEEFVKGNNQNDEAVSDIFKLKDKGERNLALRYEFTFQLKRLANNKKLPYKRYQIGPVFRDEPVTSNRFRQFTQCDADIVGSTTKDEAEVLALAYKILKDLKIKAEIKVNNRKLLNEILDKEKIKEEFKEKVIRELDKLDKLPEKEVRENLRKYEANQIVDILKKPESYFKIYKSYSEIEELKKFCKLYGLNISFQPSLARGLAYYNRSVYEIKTKEMKETICGGGSYIINGIQSTGWSFGLERLSQIAKIKEEKQKILIISLNQDKKAIELADKFRSLNIPCNVFFGKPSKALEYANSYFIPYVIFIGDDETKRNKFKLKNMSSGKEKLIGERELLKELG